MELRRVRFTMRQRTVAALAVLRRVRFTISQMMVMVALAAVLIPPAVSLVRYLNRPRYWDVVITKRIGLLNPAILKAGNGKAIRVGREQPNAARAAARLDNLKARLKEHGVEYRIE